MGEIVETTLDGRPALTVMLPGKGGSDIHANGNIGGLTKHFVGLQWPARRTLADVDGATIFVLEWARTPGGLGPVRPSPTNSSHRSASRGKTSHDVPRPGSHPSQPPTAEASMGSPPSDEILARRRPRWLRRRWPIDTDGRLITRLGAPGDFGAPWRPDIDRPLQPGSYRIDAPFDAPFSIGLPNEWTLRTLSEGDVSFQNTELVDGGAGSPSIESIRCSMTLVTADRSPHRAHPRWMG